ncbi:MAG: DUF4143 domain-containing protein [Bacteroidales bacterium]|jgi:predicted AAA+ superfamily ATPase|nr:DUF4143 domain-containing protein [Bacteroidales bacterium]
MKYRNRLIENELIRKLNASGAVLIKGAKSCGKTETAKQFAASILEVDQDENVPEIMKIAPKRLLLGATPRLIDEWQEQPKLWQYIRHEVDDRQMKGQFILTGSANPEETAKMHSGAGRFTTLLMHTMSWQELGYSSGKISLKHLFDGNKIDVADSPVDLEFIVEKIIIGGFPALLGAKTEQAIDVNRAYINLISEVDMSRVSDIKRSPDKVKSLLRSLARNIATTVENTTLSADINEKENSVLSRPTIIDYIDALKRLMILEDQPAWNPHIRSSSSLRKSPKRHLTDVSLAVAALGANKNSLLNDLKYTGFLFESLATHDLRIYAQANDAEVFYYHDSSGLEADAIVQKYSGEWCAFEIKLGVGQIEEAAQNLTKLVETVDLSKISPPKSLNIIIGTGISYTRADGINVISLGSLGV